MKRFRLLFLLGVGLLVGGQSLSVWAKQKEGGKEEKAKKELQLKQEINDQTFIIEVDRALPQSGSAVNLTSLYSLSLNKDSVESHLPYFGRAYSVPYGGQGGLRFESTISDYKIAYNDKGNAKISFRTRTDDDSYTFNIDLYSNGNAFINVTPVNKQGISYQGHLAKDKK